MANRRVDAKEQLRIITECRQSGLSDHQWCEEHGIPPSTFYNWVTKLRKKACYDIPQSKSKRPKSRQDVVPIDIISDSPATPSVLPLEENTVLTSAGKEVFPTVEIVVHNIPIRFNNSVDPVLLNQIIHLLKGFSC